MRDACLPNRDSLGEEIGHYHAQIFSKTAIKFKDCTHRSRFESLGMSEASDGVISSGSFLLHPATEGGGVVSSTSSLSKRSLKCGESLTLSKQFELAA